MDNFCVFILTHGRPGNVITLDTLKRQGYTGKVCLVVDNQDSKLDEYKSSFGDSIIIFDKESISKTFDSADNSTDYRAVVYARNSCFDIAKELGIEYFLELDDDYTSFVYKFTETFEYKERPVMNLDGLFTSLLEYYKSIPALTIAIAQCGDFIGGGSSGMTKSIKIKRKAMNTFFCSTLRPFRFIGRVNEDVNTYITLGNRGQLIFTIPYVAIHQLQTQSNPGGMSELYQDEGTYWKSFYPVMFSPSCVKVHEMGEKHKRIHHRVNWNNAVPKIMALV